MLFLAVCDDMPTECADIAKQIEGVLTQFQTEFLTGRSCFTAGKTLTLSS